MKKVDESIRDNISDLIAGKGLSISEFALEKDFIVTDVLRAISRIKDPTFDLVFCGGTCLSKAYGLLERISEDVDIKVVPKSGITLSQGQHRSKISNLKKEIVKALLSVGFVENEIKQEALDGNAYVVFNAGYSSHFDVSAAMRAWVKLELNSATLTLPSVDFDIGYLFSELAGIVDPQKFQMPCVNIEEALAEKLVSFPRRLAMHLSDPARFTFDKALVRHLFDVSQILGATAVQIQPKNLQPLLAAAMDKDAQDFANQFPGFLTKPVTEMLSAMSVARSDAAYRKLYDDFVKVMVYGQTSPTFDEAIDHFDEILLSSLPASNTNYLHHKPAPVLAK
jgi:predicted nucleotidyltransferase component of viral defense system